MIAVKSDLEKLEELLNSATNERQRKMYQALLKKAWAKLTPVAEASPEKTAESLTETVNATAKCGSAKSTKKKSKARTSKETKSLNEGRRQEAGGRSHNSRGIQTHSSLKTAKSETGAGALDPKRKKGKEQLNLHADKSFAPSALELHADKSFAPSKAEALATKKTLESTNNSHSKKKGRGAIALDEGSIASGLAQSSSKKQSSKTKKKVFQAVGIIKCTPQIEDEKLFVTINGISYNLKRGAGRLNKPFEELKSELESNGSREMFLRVYPNITHYRDGGGIGYSFLLVRPYLNQAQYPVYPEGFIFRGVFRSIPYCPTPVISIYRNLETLPIYKQLSTAAKKFFVRSQDFPVVWSAPVEPFIYNSQLPKSEQMPRYFVEVVAIFKDGQYIVTEMLTEPSLKVPGFVKPKKKNQKPVQQSD